MAPPPAMGLLDGLVAARLWSATKEMLRAFLAPDLGLDVPPDLLVGLLVFGVFLVVAGTAFAHRGKGAFARVAALGAGVALAGWVLFGGTGDVATFFVVILLVLKFLGGVTLVLGIFRSFWVPAALLLAIMLAATGTLPAAPLALGLGVFASLLGALSLLRRAEDFSPGRRGSRWNRRTAVGWVVCLLVAGMLRQEGLGAHGKDFKLAGMVVGGALLFLFPGMVGAGVKVRLAKK